jgi:PEP-CTERM motif
VGYLSSGANVIGEYGLDGSTFNANAISSEWLAGSYGIANEGNELYVANDGTGYIGEYTTSGTTLFPHVIAHGLNNPWSIAVSGSDMFIANNTSGTIGEYTTSGATVNASLVSGLDDPTGMVLSGGNLFVVSGNSSWGGTVGEYTTSGATINASLLTVNFPYTVVQGGNAITTYSLAISGDDLFIVNFITGIVGEYTTSGATVNASLISGLNLPTGMAISGNDLFIANGGNVGEYGLDGSTINASLISGLNSTYGIIVVPEPSPIALAGLGAAAAWLWRRKQNEQA